MAWSRSEWGKNRKEHGRHHRQQDEMAELTEAVQHWLDEESEDERPDD